MSRSSMSVLAVAIAAGACSGSTSPSDPVADARQAVPDGAAPDAAPGQLATFHADAAAAVCGALFRCCDGVDQEDYFAPFRASERLAAWHDRLPPAATLDQPGCREVVAEMFAVTPFGDWVAAAVRGEIEFDGVAFASCVGALDQAACGAPVRDALFDSTCFGFAAPGGGDQQRSMFTRTAGIGADCSPIRDGIGAAFFGTCDPTAAYCCYTDPGQPELDCTFPFDGDGEPRAGTCAAAAVEDESCSQTPPLAICATGLSCDPGTLSCVAEGTDTLDIGDRCVDEGFNLLGDCVDSFCDILGSSECEPLRSDGAECSAAYECASGACDQGTCGPSRTCDGTGGGDGADAGVDPDAAPNADAGVDPDAAPVADAGVDPDAAPVADAGPDGGTAAADGETCETAFDLLATATASSEPGYDLVVTGTFGASNDYNPYQDAMPSLPPACSVVYDASGAEVVYAVELQPGDDLLMRYAITPGTVPGGLYLLDECGATISWPDYDDSGACGNNEYKSQGYCGFFDCEPLTWTFHYPEMLDGSPTAPKTFWIVADHLTGPATTYQLDFRIDP
jgi:hypothetical protein